MPQSVDTLYLEINAKAVKANDAIDRLVGKLNGLTTSLGKLNTSNLNGLANGVQKLGNAMQVMNTVKTADFTRLARNLSSMGNINTQGLNNTASSLSQITRAMNNIGAVSHNAVQLSEMAKNLSKFGGANVQRATVNIPLLANELRKLMMTLSSAPNVSRNIIDMTNALANLSTQGSKVGSASRSIQRSLNGTHSSTVKASKGFNGLASAIGKFYASYFMVIRGVKGIWSSIESTADYIEAYNYFNVALGKIGSDWAHEYEKYGYESADAYAESFNKRLTEGLKDLSGVQVSIGADGKGLLTETGMKNLGLNIQEVTQYASQLASVTNSVGQTGEVSLATANAFTKLGADMSSLFNMDYSQVMKNLQSGLIGQSRALYRYGLDITNATLQTYAYELGLSKAVSEMTQAEKMQLRMIAILDQSKVSWGDLANTINSPSNLMRIFKNNLKETGMMLGQLFIPMLSKVVPILNGVTIAFKRLLVNIASFMGVELDLDAFGQGYNDLEDDTGSLGDSYDDLAESIKEAKSQLLGFDEVNKLQDTSATATVDAEMGGIDLTDEILKATDEYQKIWQEAFDKMEANSNKWADGIEKALSGIGDVFEDFALGEYFKAGEDVSQLVIDLNNFIAKAIKNVDWQGIGKNVGLFLKGIKWTEIIMSLSDVIYSAFDGLWEAWIESMKESPIETALLTAIALTGIDVVRNALASKLSTVGGTASSPISIKTYLAITVVGIQASKKLGEMIGEAITAGDYDPQVQIDARKEYEEGIQGIIDKYETLNEKVALYVELSKNYDTLSAEDKDYVSQMAKDLKASGIIEGIDDITGAWHGTNEELSKAIQQQMILAKLSSAQGRVSDLEAQYAEELERNAKLKEKASGFSLYHVKYQKDYEKSTEELKHLEMLLQGAQADVTIFENQYKDLMGIIGNADLVDDAFKSNKKEESIWKQLSGDMKAFNKAFNKYGNLNKFLPLAGKIGSKKPTGLTSLPGMGAGAIMPEVLSDDAIAELDRLILGYENTEEEIERNPIKPNINNGRYVNGLNSMQTLFNGVVLDVNNANIEPKMKSAGIFDTIRNIANEYNTNKNTIEKQNISPALVGTSIFNTLTSIKNTYDTNKNTIEKSKIKPTIDSASVDKESKGIFDTITNNLKGIKSTVKVEADSNSLNTFADSIATRIAKIKLAFETKEENGGFFATLKKIAGFKTGGFPEDGLFMANHGELVGKFSNGKTAVANNEQITQGIAQAVAPAVYSAVVSAMQNTQRGNSDVVVNIDGKQVFKAVQRQANDYTAQTGLSPFNI